MRKKKQMLDTNETFCIMLQSPTFFDRHIRDKSSKVTHYLFS